MCNGRSCQRAYIHDVCWPTLADSVSTLALPVELALLQLQEWFHWALLCVSPRISVLFVTAANQPASGDHPLPSHRSRDSMGMCMLACVSCCLFKMTAHKELNFKIQIHFPHSQISGGFFSLLPSCTRGGEFSRREYN